MPIFFQPVEADAGATKGDLMSDPTAGLPARPSLEQLRKRAKELLRAARAGDVDALARFRTAATEHRRTPLLADAQFVVARESGFSTWPELVRYVQSVGGASVELPPLIRPIELRARRPFPLSDGTTVDADHVYAMFVAAREGDLDTVKSLIGRAPRLATVEYNYTPPIHFAVREGHLGIVELLLDRGADLAYTSYPFGESLLTYADEHQHRDVAAFLRRQLARRFSLGAGAKQIIGAARDGNLARVGAELARDGTLARASDDTGDTALHQAAYNGHVEIVELLLAHGADPDAERGDGYRPIHLALMPNWKADVAADRARAIADELLSRGVRYTVFIAALRGDRDFIQSALRSDRSLANEEDSCHRRPLSAAVERGDRALAELLLEHGAQPNAAEAGAPRGTALWTAVHKRRVDLVTLLLDHGADPNGAVESSGTPMDQARPDPVLRELLRAHGGVEEGSPRDRLARLISERRFEDVAQMIQESPAIMDEAYWYEGILSGPAHSGDHEMIDFLMRLGARVPPVSKWAPFYYFKHEATAAFLLAHGMEPNHMSWHRLTLLHHMAASGELAKARLLLDHGAAIDAIDDEYRSTPLGVAARRGHKELAQLLLDEGADPEIAGAPWATPLAWARSRGHDEIAAMLSANGDGM
jgi:ankyrin repeat protein